MFYDKYGTRLTDCCGAYSTFMEVSGDMDIEEELTCKNCYETVPYGQGDGSEKKAWIAGLGLEKA